METSVQTKVCIKCGEDKELEKFQIHRSSGNRRNVCHECQLLQKREYGRVNSDRIKEQRKKYRLENPEKVKERKRRYYQSNKEQILLKSKKYFEENKEHNLKQQKVYYEKNKDWLSETYKEYRLKNKERLKQYFKKYGEENKDKISEKRKKYYWKNREENIKKSLEYVKKNPEKVSKKKREWKRRDYLENPEKYILESLKRLKVLKEPQKPKWCNPLLIKRIYKKMIDLREEGYNVSVDHIIPLNGRVVCGLHIETNLRIIDMVENSSKGNRFKPCSDSELPLNELELDPSLLEDEVGELY